MPLHNLLKRGSDFGPIEVYISETVRDSTSASINHWQEFVLHKKRSFCFAVFACQSASRSGLCTHRVWWSASRCRGPLKYTRRQTLQSVRRHCALDDRTHWRTQSTKIAPELDAVTVRAPGWTTRTTDVGRLLVSFKREKVYSSRYKNTAVKKMDSVKTQSGGLPEMHKAHLSWPPIGKVIV